MASSLTKTEYGTELCTVDTRGEVNVRQFWGSFHAEQAQADYTAQLTTTKLQNHYFQAINREVPIEKA